MCRAGKAECSIQSRFLPSPAIPLVASARLGYSRPFRSTAIFTLRRFKEDVNEVRAGFECGMTVSNFSDVKVGDILECFKMEKTAILEVASGAERVRQQESVEARRN